RGAHRAPGTLPCWACGLAVRAASPDWADDRGADGWPRDGGRAANSAPGWWRFETTRSGIWRWVGSLACGTPEETLPGTVPPRSRHRVPGGTRDRSRDGGTPPRSGRSSPGRPPGTPASTLHRVPRQGSYSQPPTHSLKCSPSVTDCSGRGKSFVFQVAHFCRPRICPLRGVRQWLTRSVKKTARFRTMNDADYLNRLRLPHVGHHIGVEVPEAVLPAQEFVMVMTDARRSAQPLKPFVEFRPETLGGIRAVLGDVEQNLLDVVPGFRGKNEKPRHWLVALARRRSSIISRSALKTSSPSINSPRSAWRAPSSSFALS